MMMYGGLSVWMEWTLSREWEIVCEEVPTVKWKDSGVIPKRFHRRFGGDSGEIREIPSEIRGRSWGDPRDSGEIRGEIVGGSPGNALGGVTGSRLPPAAGGGETVSLPGPGPTCAPGRRPEGRCVTRGAFAISLALGGAMSGFPSSMRAESDGVRFRVTFS
jgi:hypothetical protein